MPLWFLCSSPHSPIPTYHPLCCFFVPAPSLYHSIWIACVWILMLITPRLKIAVQSVISPRNRLMTNSHTNMHACTHPQRRVSWRRAFVVLHRRSLNQGSGLCGIASFLSLWILPPNSCFSVWKIIHATMSYCIKYTFNSQLCSLNYCWWGWCCYIAGDEGTPSSPN